MRLERVNGLVAVLCFLSMASCSRPVDSPPPSSYRVDNVAFKNEFQTLWPPLMAASVVAIVPILVLFVAFQRYFVAGVASAAVKG